MKKMLMMGLIGMISLTLLFAGCSGQEGSSGSAKQEGHDEIQGPAVGGPVGQNIDRGIRGPRAAIGSQSMEACSGKSAGDVCTVQFRNRSADGKCVDRNGILTCQLVNADMVQRPPMHGGQSDAFWQACGGKTAGDSCNVALNNRTVDGTCGERFGNLTCIPKVSQ